MTLRKTVFNKSLFCSFATAIMLSNTASAQTFTAVPTTNDVIQGEFDSGADNVFIPGNGNSNRVGRGGATNAGRGNNPVLGFQLPSIPALAGGGSIDSITFSVVMASPAFSPVATGPAFDVVVSVLGVTSASEIDGTFYSEGLDALGTGNALFGVIPESNVTDFATVTLTINAGNAAFDQIVALYNANGAPSQDEIYFRFSPSADLLAVADNSRRILFDRDANSVVNRTLEFSVTPGTGGGATFIGQPVDSNGFADLTGSLGFVNVNVAPWYYFWNLDTFVFIPSEPAVDQGFWAYVIKNGPDVNTGTSWGGYSADAQGFINADNWLGVVNVSLAPYLFVVGDASRGALNGFIYALEPQAGFAGTWVYIFP